MNYWIWLKGKNEDDDPYLFTGNTGGISEKQIEHTDDQFVEKRLKLCKTCIGSISHVIEEETGRKFCPILFSDLVKPGWTAEDVLC